jgi:hypothetical protein
MDYAITTLEIEIGRLEYAIRIAKSTTCPGNLPDIEAMHKNAAEVKEAAQILSRFLDNKNDNPEEGEEFER